ncbi:MAG: hypothetical protein MRY57_04030 [Candidatus Pacebacteria bacterium]|nr:hypothetical protein [Candidatus Paceibacterota bacterium]
MKKLLRKINTQTSRSIVLGLALSFALLGGVSSVLASNVVPFIGGGAGNLIERNGSLTIGDTTSASWIVNQVQDCIVAELSAPARETCLDVSGGSAFINLLVDRSAYLTGKTAIGNFSGGSATSFPGGIPGAFIVQATQAGFDSILVTGLARLDQSGNLAPRDLTTHSRVCAQQDGTLYTCSGGEVTDEPLTYDWQVGEYGPCSDSSAASCSGSYTTTSSNGGSCEGSYTTTGSSNTCSGTYTTSTGGQSEVNIDSGTTEGVGSNVGRNLASYDEANHVYNVGLNTTYADDSSDLNNLYRIEIPETRTYTISGTVVRTSTSSQYINSQLRIRRTNNSLPAGGEVIYTEMENGRNSYTFSFEVDLNAGDNIHANQHVRYNPNGWFASSNWSNPSNQSAVTNQYHNDRRNLSLNINSPSTSGSTTTNSCSNFDGNEGFCNFYSSCTWGSGSTTNSCSGPTSQSACESQNDSCTWNANSSTTTNSCSGPTSQSACTSQNSACSFTPAGESSRERVVTCQDSLGNTHPDQTCIDNGTGPKPETSTTEGCFASPVCGSANGTTGPQPSGDSLCSVGTATQVYPSAGAPGFPTTYTWSCNSGAETVSCSSQSPVNNDTFDWDIGDWGTCSGGLQSSGSCSGTPTGGQGGKIDWNGNPFNWTDGYVYNTQTINDYCPHLIDADMANGATNAQPISTNGGGGSGSATACIAAQGAEFPTPHVYEISEDGTRWNRHHVSDGSYYSNGYDGARVYAAGSVYRSDYGYAPARENGRRFRGSCQDTAGQNQNTSYICANDDGEWVGMNEWCSPITHTSLPANPGFNDPNGTQSICVLSGPSNGSCSGGSQSTCESVAGCNWNAGSGGSSGGTQSRSVVCRDQNGQLAPDSSCPPPKPDTTQSCGRGSGGSGTPGCYPIVYPNEIFGDYDSTSYNWARTFCDNATTKTACIGPAYHTNNVAWQGTPNSYGSLNSAVPPIEWDQIARNSYGNTSHLLVDLGDFDSSGFSLPYDNGDGTHTIGPICMWGELRS